DLVMFSTGQSCKLWISKRERMVITSEQFAGVRGGTIPGTGRRRFLQCPVPRVLAATGCVLPEARARQRRRRRFGAGSDAHGLSKGRTAPGSQTISGLAVHGGAQRR